MASLLIGIQDAGKHNERSAILFCAYIKSFVCKTTKDQHDVFTLEYGAYLPPGCHPTLTGVLAQCRLQEEQRDTTEEEHEKVRDEEGSCK